MINSVSLVIPVFNNEKTLNKYLNECYRLLQREKLKFEFILCDDGSSDQSLSLLLKFKKTHENIIVLVHKKNLGIAHSLKDLYSKAKNKYVVLFSADGGWNPQDVIRLIKFIIKIDGDIVIGKRNDKKYTLIRKIISFFYNVLPFILFGINLFDVGSVKIFKTSIYKKVKTKSKSVFFEAEFLIKAAKLGYNINTIPVSHKKNRKNKSSINYKIVLDSLLDLFRLRLGF